MKNQHQNRLKCNGDLSLEARNSNNSLKKTDKHLYFQLNFLLFAGKGWWNVRCHACEELSKVYLSGHASRNKPREIVLPVSVECALSPSDIKKYLKALQLPEYVTHGLVLILQFCLRKKGKTPIEIGVVTPLFIKLLPSQP